MKLATLLAFLLALITCAPFPPAIGSMDEAFTREERVAIYDAAEDWNKHTNGEHKIVPGLPGWPYFILKEDPGGGKVGTCNPILGTIKLKPGMPIDLLHATARHELGHALGFHHVPRGWMSADVYLDAQFSTDDEAECRRIGVC